MPWLEWYQRNEDLKATAKTPYRLLQPVQSLSYGEPDSANMLIQGDNLEALKALLPYYAGQVKCIFIDPPYNTKSAFEHYDDNLEHAQWLSMMYPRMVLLRELLAEDGSFWITIDDNEAHYFKVMCDEIFGRKNFVANVIWEKADSPRMDAKQFSSRHDHLFVYSKNIDLVTINRLANPDDSISHYNKIDEYGRRYYLKPLRAMGADGTREARPSLYFSLTAPDGTLVYPKNPDGSDSRWRWKQSKFEEDKDRIEWIKTKNGWSVNSRLYLDNSTGRPPETIWFNADVGSNRTSKAEIKNLNVNEKSFDTPKPERLMQRIINIASSEGDLILDSFLGSGTTAAVAHKMGRRWIGIEMGEHAKSHCQPRLQKVVDGEGGGISSAVDWKGGGGFQFYKLGPKVFNEQGCINPDIKFEHLAAHVWFAETGSARSTRAMKSPKLGEHNGTAYYLLYNGILGDDSLSGGNMLTLKVLAKLPVHKGPKVIFGAGTNLTKDRLRSLGITFKQTPYDIRAR